jgi:outer membrane protein TolC
MIKKSVALGFLFLLPLASIAEKRPLSLDEAVALGLEASPGLHASRMRAEALAARSREVQAGRLPAFRVGGGYTRLSEVPPFAVDLPIFPSPIVVSQNYFNSFSLRLGVEQPLFTGFRLQAGVESARMLERSAGHDLDKDRAEFIFAVKTAYWELQRAREFEKVIAENIRRVDEHLKDVRAFFEQGLLTRNDVLRVELELSNAALRQIEARDAGELALAGLNSLIGLPLDADIDPTTAPGGPLSGLDAAADPREGTEVEPAVSNRPELRSADFRIKASEFSLKAARAGTYPQVFLSGHYYYLRPNPRIMPALDRFRGTWDVAVSVSFDLWDWGKTKSQEEQARAQLAQARDARKLLEDQAILEITQSRLSLSRAREKVRVAELAVTQAGENLRVTREKFKQGVALNTEVMDAELSLLQAELNRTQSDIDLELARAKLEKALGR